MTAPAELRAGNVASLVDALRRHGTLSRSQLARKTGLSRSTVVSILAELEDAGFVTVRGSASSAERGLGRPAARLALHPSAGVALGVAVGREYAQAVVADLSSALLAHRQARFDGGLSADPLLDVVLELAEAALEEAGVRPRMLVGAALAAAGPSAAAVSAALGERFGTPVEIESDARLEALAELATGAGQDFRHLLYVRAGWRLGGAIILEGRLRRGWTGTAGELSHIPVRGGDGPLCPCGRRGCLESVAAGWALLDAMATARASELDLDDLADLATSGDPGARRALSDAGAAIGTALAGVCTALNPEAVIIGGELGFAGSPLVDAARQRIARDVHPTVGPVQVRPAALGGVAAALGAAGLVARSSDSFGHRVAIS